MTRVSLEEWAEREADERWTEAEIFDALASSSA